MNKLLTAVLVFMAFAIWQIASPYYTIYQIKQAVEQQDENKLARYVNFSVLKQNLKSQLQVKLQQHVEQQNGSFFGMLALATTEKTLDRLLDQLVSPSTILLYMNGKRPFERKLNAIGGWSQNPNKPQTIPVLVVENTVPEQSISKQSMSKSSTSDSKDLNTFKSNKHWTTSFDSLSKFSVFQQRDNGTQIRYLLTRSGAGWQLSNIILPVH